MLFIDIESIINITWSKMHDSLYPTFRNELKIYPITHSLQQYPETPENLQILETRLLLSSP